MTIRGEQLGEQDKVHELLRASGLPVPGGDEPPTRFVIADAGSGIEGCAGLQHQGDDWLIRSVAVRADRRHGGLGSDLVRAIVAKVPPGREAWLFTRDAAAFFARFGFRPAERTDAPPGIASSAEFRHACAENATLMRRPA